MGIHSVLLLSSTLIALSRASTVDDATKYSKENVKDIDADLLKLAAIPSISSLPEHARDIVAASEWLIEKLKAAGLENVKLLPTKAQPSVYAEWLRATGAPTVLIYGHYDVQPVDPLELWDTPPFEPKVDRKDKMLFNGRGVSDDKGGLLQPIHAVEAYLKTSKQLPVNVKFLLEGQEEIGSPNLAELLQEHKDLLRADIALSADGGQISPKHSGIALGLRGAVAFEVEAQTVDVDLHSGMKGGSVQNPIHALAQFIDNLHAPNGSVKVEGFYRGVQERTAEDIADAAAYPFDEEAEMKSLGALGPHGEDGYTTLERRWLRPTLEVVGIWGGFTGTGIKTIVPSKATAKISCRLVPDQDPVEVLEALRAHTKSHAPPQTRLTFRKLPFHAQPYLMPRDTVANRAATKVLKEHFEGPFFYREGGSIPALALMKEHLGIWCTSFGFGLSTDNLHSPNERYMVSMWDKGREAWIKLLHEMSVLGSGQEEQAEPDMSTVLKDEL
ncbi:g1864 [Coccomyxa viridis]|uniref:G1864 protein n=1 Tax=Coccomyxa viridis TaxID=1274662 RepID=A0ABP1FQV0_9CHLO